MKKKLRKVTEGEFILLLFAVWKFDIIYVNGFINLSSNCNIMCTVCGHRWSTRATHLLHKHGCPKCAHKKRGEKRIPSLEEMKEKVYKVWKNLISYVSGYTKIAEKCKWKCNNCSHEWEATVDSILHKHGCPICGHKKGGATRIIPLEEFLIKLKEIWGDEIQYVRGYVCIAKKCWFRCKKGHEWKARPIDILAKRGCGMCSKYSLEEPFKKLLDSLNINYIYNEALEGSNYKGSKQALRPDFLIINNTGKLCVELDGKQHFHPIHGEKALKFQQEKDRHKDKVLKNKGFIVIRVTSSPTKEWGTKKHLIMSKIFNLVKDNTKNGLLNIKKLEQYDFNRE